jgi:hypothetical protein
MQSLTVDLDIPATVNPNADEVRFTGGTFAEPGPLFVIKANLAVQE